MAIDKSKVAQTLRAFHSLNEEEQEAAYEIIRRHQSSYQPERIRLLAGWQTQGDRGVSERYTLTSD